MKPSGDTPELPDRTPANSDRNFPATTDSVWDLLRCFGAGESSPRADGAFAEVVRRYKRPVFVALLGKCLRSGFNQQDAEDLTQEVFSKLHQAHALSRGERVGSFRTFLRKCSEWCFLDWVDRS